MSEQTPEQSTAEQQPPAEPATGDETVDYKDRFEAQQKVNRDLERKFKAAQSEVDKVRKATMSEADQAIEAARTEGRTAAAVDFGKRLARTQFDAAAGRRNPDIDTGSVLEYVDLARFVGDDGEPDDKAISAAVERLVPAPSGTPTPAFDGGTRTTATGGGNPMNNLLRQQAGRT